MIKLKIFTIFILLALFIAIPNSCMAAENLARNPSFEAQSGGKPADWETWGYNGTSEFKAVKGIAHSGDYYAEIISGKEDDSRFKQTVNVEEGAVYKLSCWMKTENVSQQKTGANISIEGRTVNSNDLKGTNTEWTYTEMYIKAGTGVNSINITLGLGGYGNTNTGKADFDDVTIEKVENIPQGVTVFPIESIDSNGKQPADGKSANNGAQNNASNTSGGTIPILVLAIVLAIAATLYAVARRSPMKKKTERAIYTDDIIPDDNAAVDKESAEKISLNGKANTPGKLVTSVKKSPVIGKSLIEKLTLDRKDFIIMAVMTAVYLVIALINLGSLQAPGTSWIPGKSGESFVLDLGKERTLSRITFYCGLGVGRDPDGKFNVEYLDASGKYVPMTYLEKNNGEIFRWKYMNVPSVKTNHIRITAENAGAEIGEIGLFEAGSTKPAEGVKITEKNADSSDTGSVENLFDEPEKVVYTPSFMNSMYFDEIYHARTAYENLHRIEPFENTHPPLGKILISFGIAIFGMTAFGWRIVGTLFGVAMIPVMYMFGKKLFKGRFYAFCAAFLMMTDFMHFTQTRIATIDVYVTFFIILMYYYMYDYFINKSYAIGFRLSLKPLLLSGIFFGLGAASKWIALYGAAGLALLFFLAKYYEFRDYNLASRSKKYGKLPWVQEFIPLYINRTLIYCVLCFILIPAIIYILSYIPFMMVPGPGHQLKDVFSYQLNMYNYHAHLVATHPYSSSWWQWPIMTKPVWAYGGGQYYELAGDKVSSIFLFGNPAIWWTGIVTALVSLIIAINKKDKKMVAVFIAIAAQYLPWMLVPRLTFIYHYFSIVPFIILTIVYTIKYIMDKYPRGKYVVYVYLAIAALLFVWFYPVLSGMEVSRSYTEHLNLLKTWGF